MTNFSDVLINIAIWFIMILFLPFAILGLFFCSVAEAIYYFGKGLKEYFEIMLGLEEEEDD